MSSSRHRRDSDARRESYDDYQRRDSYPRNGYEDGYGDDYDDRYDRDGYGSRDYPDKVTSSTCHFKLYSTPPSPDIFAISEDVRVEENRLRLTADTPSPQSSPAPTSIATALQTTAALANRLTIATKTRMKAVTRHSTKSSTPSAPARRATLLLGLAL